MKQYLLRCTLSCFVFITCINLIFSQGTCGEIVPFASEPIVDGCCVTYEMDLSLGVNWILYPGNDLDQSETITSFSNNGNTVTYCYESAEGVIYPNITYLDANWNITCSSFYPITLDCELDTECGFAEMEVVGCALHFTVVDSDFATQLIYKNSDGDIVGSSLFNPHDFQLSGIRVFDTPGVYTVEVVCYTAEFEFVSSYEITFIIAENCTTELDCGLFDLEVDGCWLYFTINPTSSSTKTYYVFEDGDRVQMNGFPPHPTTRSGRRFFDTPGQYRIVVECTNSEGGITVIEFPFEITEDCGDKEDRSDRMTPRSSNLTNNLQVNVFPNPATESIFLEAKDQTIKNVQLFDLNNRLIQNHTINQKDNFEIDLREIEATGFYIIKFSTEFETYNYKVMVVK